MDYRPTRKHHPWAIVSSLVVLILAVGAVYYLLHRPDSTPKTTDKPAQTTSAVDKQLASMSLEDKVASLFILHTPGTSPAAIQAFVDQYHPGGMILMEDNIPADETQVTAVSKVIQGSSADFPRLVAIDEEGGSIKRLKSDNFKSALNLDQYPPSEAFTAFQGRSQLLKSLDINLNFGIVADVTDDPNSFIFQRVLDTTPSSAADRVEQAVLGEKGNVLSTLKHFPGHGETNLDSHTTVPTTDISYQAWLARDAIPFQGGIKAGAPVVMFGQLIYSSVDSEPATLSKKWHDILRNDLHFTGLTVTDDMIMLLNSDEAAYSDPVQNAIDSINAGSDMLLYITNHGTGSHIDPAELINGVVAAINDGKISEGTIDNAVRAVLTAQHKSLNE